MTKKRNLGDWTECSPNICWLRQNWTKYWEQGKEIKYNWPGLENFDVYICVLFRLLVAKFNFWKRN